jgi:signal transduction histidine kinase
MNLSMARHDSSLEGSAAESSQADGCCAKRPLQPGLSRLASYSGPPSVEEVWGMLQRIIDGLPEQIAVLDADWNILLINRPWNQVAQQHGMALQPGENYRTYFETFATFDHDAATVIAGLDDISSGRRVDFCYIYAADGPNLGRDFQISLSTFECCGKRFGTATRQEVTELLAMRRRQRELRHRFRFEERRRIGRELHDSTAQTLVALQLGLIRLKGLQDDSRSDAIFAEIDEAIEQMHHEIRAISHLFNPRELTEEGLGMAIEAMARGFSLRSGLNIEVSREGSLKTRSESAELAFYRVSQEALANILRHSYASEARIRLISRPRTMHLVISDNGIGIPQNLEALPENGTGVRGMRQRIEELGGRFSLSRRTRGTVMAASIPIGRSAPRFV